MTTVAAGRSEFARSLSPRQNSFPARPVFDDVEDERRFRKQRLAAALRIFGKLGYNEGAAGHITVRDPELPDHFWVNPLGRAFSRIKASELLLVNHDGEIVHGDHPVNQAAFAIHSQIHQARPDVDAAAHSHSIWGKALAALGTELLPISQDSAQFYEDNVIVPDFSGLVLDLEEGRRIASTLGHRRLAILANHGLLTVGRSLEEAVSLYVAAERNSKVQVVAQAAGQLQLIPHEIAQHTRQQYQQHRDPGWVTFAPLFEEIVHEQPDLLD
ncbi:class II aldolase/adducin family protein [Saccharopolyspora sp. NPDC050389]|uniref:class II aldolase/adducin family protein n=1 Tax=Saccharopolyspora sp. NPDC050389 TaxID=3155516 RepID=UPI0033E457F3